MFYLGFFCKKNERFAHSLIIGERCERFAQKTDKRIPSLGKVQLTCLNLFKYVFDLQKHLHRKFDSFATN